MKNIILINLVNSIDLDKYFYKLSLHINHKALQIITIFKLHYVTIKTSIIYYVIIIINENKTYGVIYSLFYKTEIKYPNIESPINYCLIYKLERVRIFCKHWCEN